MRVKWKLLSVGAALCLTSPGVMAQSQERPAPERGTVTARPNEPPGEVDGMPMEGLDAMDDIDGLESLLAADIPGGHGGRRGPGMRHGLDGEGLREKLNLSGDQKSKLADIHDRQARAAIPIEGDLRIARLDLHKLMRADRPNRQAIDAQIDRLAGLRARLQKAHVASMLEARTVLTPEQQKLMREHGGGMMGHRMHGGHGRAGKHFMDDPLARPRR